MIHAAVLVAAFLFLAFVVVIFGAFVLSIFKGLPTEVPKTGHDPRTCKTCLRGGHA